jgi:hypothetical protein
MIFTYLIEVIKTNHKLILCLLFLLFLAFLKLIDILEEEGLQDKQSKIGVISSTRYYDSRPQTKYIYEIVTNDGVKASAKSFWECKAFVGAKIQYVKYKSFLHGEKYEITDCEKAN